MKDFLKYLGYRIFCLIFFFFFFLLYYLFFRWFLLGDKNEYLTLYSFIATTATYFAAGMTKRREIWQEFIKNFDLHWLLFLCLFRIIIFFIVWAGLCLVFEIADRTVLRFVFNDYLTESYGYRWLLIPTVFIEYKYNDDRLEIIKKIYKRYKNK